MTAIPLSHRGGVSLPHPELHPRPAPAPRPRARASLRAVPQATRRQLIPTWAYSMIASCILVVGVIGIVALNALAAEASFRARTLESTISDMTLRHDDLVAAVAVLEAPARVRDVARSQLGLVDIEQPGFLTLDDAQLFPSQPKPPQGLPLPGLRN